VNRRAFLAAIPLALMPPPERPLYRLSGYTASGGWAEEIAGADGLRCVQDGHPLGAVHTWVWAERWDAGWLPLD
jgi:hypothetical protein